jgi:hypothetical protein
MADNFEGIHMPELIIYEFLKTIQKIVKNDYDSSVDKNDSILSLLFKNDRQGKNIALETFDYFSQAERIIIKDGFQVNIGYNSEVSKAMGCVHILMPTESSDAIGIGGNEGYQDNIIDSSNSNFTPVFEQNFNTSYNLLISSLNSLEVVVIYNFLKACFLSLHDHLELYGLQNLKMSGSDIQMQSDLVPTQIYHRSLTLSFSYEMIIPKLYKTKIAKDFKLTGIILPP